MGTKTVSTDSTPRVPVRWPFRLLAALVVVAGIVATVGTLLAGWHRGEAALRWQLLASLPGVAWLVRVAWYAAVRGRSPTPEYWPFASQSVFSFYVVVWFVVMCV